MLLILQSFRLRGDIKYYFADFVRKGGTPPPLYEQNFRQQKVTDISLKICLQKGLKIVFFAKKKTPILVQKIGY